ncbi:hypothetical protein I4U23_027246 [Adineta vaga]|nr:hypothetical protein I4U23_027246 [Adineta vaga]
MIPYGRGTTGFVLTFISLIAAFFATTVSIAALIIFNYHQLHNRLKEEEKITLILSINIYVTFCLYSISMIKTNTQTLLGDVYGYSFDSAWYIFEGYFVIIMCCNIYVSFWCQALYRLCRIFYSKYRSLRSRKFFIIISVPVQVTISILIVFPLLICRKLVYQPQDHYYFVSIFDTFGYLWVTLGSYGFPIIYTSTIYIRIMRYIHRQTNNLTLMVQRRQQRDLLAVKRILVNIVALAMVAVPGFILYVVSLIDKVEYPLTQRIMYLSREIGIAVGTVGVIWINPQLRSIIDGLRQRNRVPIRTQLNRIAPITTT